MAFSLRAHAGHVSSGPTVAARHTPRHAAARVGTSARRQQAGKLRVAGSTENLQRCGAAVNPFGAPSAPVASAEPAPPATSSTSTSSQAQLPYAQHKWLWRGKYTINVASAGCGEPVVMVHGFGLSASNFRKTIQELAQQGYKVYAMDLLGFGGSSKPLLSAGYTMELWRDLVLDFLAEFTAGKPATLVGNSIGGLVSLMVAADAPAEAVRGVVLLNTAGAMNNKGILGDWRILLAYPIFLLIDFLLSIPAVAAKIFQGVRKKDNIKQALLNVYSNKAAVTDELVELVYAPSDHPNAREVFCSVITGPPGPSPFKLVPRIRVPILTLWGEDDMMTPADGPVGRFFQRLPDVRPNTTFKFLPGVGHLLHDDRPDLVHAELLPWLANLHTATGAAPCEKAAPAAKGTSS